MRSLLRLSPYYRPYRLNVMAGLLVVIVSAAVGSVPPWLSLEELRAEIGYVPKENFLFSDSIARNLEYGAPDAESDVREAKVAQLADTIESFPGGCETLLGERGINLSGQSVAPR